MGKDLESFSKKELQLYKRLSLGFITVLVIAVISCILYYFVLLSSKHKLMYCQDTGLYRTISENKIISYTEEGTNEITKENNIKSIAIKVAGNIGIYFLGSDFNKEYCSQDVHEYVQAYLVLRDNSSEINLSEMYSGIELEKYSDEFIYYPEKVENSTRYTKEWVTKSELSSDIHSKEHFDKMIKVSQSEVPKEIQEDFEGEQIIGYIPYEEKLSDCMSDKVYEKDGDYFINVKDLEVEDTYGYVSYFGEQAIDLMSLEPSQELREINPDNRFTWIMQDELTEVKGDWCYVYFKNKHHEELGVVKVKVKDNQAVDIEISGME